MVEIKISNKWLKKRFNCNEEFIKNECKGRCCEGGKKIVVTLLPEEEIRFKENGHNVVDGKLEPNKKICPFKKESGLCNIHNAKPFGCVISPFTVNKNKTLIVRHRYVHMKCFGDGELAYKTFNSSLVRLFGEEKTKNIVEKLESSEKDFVIDMDDEIFDKLIYLDKLKR